MRKKKPRTLELARRTVKALVYLSNHKEGASADDLKEHLGISHESAYRLLRTLKEEGLVRRISRRLSWNHTVTWIPIWVLAKA